MKYVVLESDLAGVKQKVPFIFPNFLVHSDAAVAAANLLRRSGRKVANVDGKVTVVSAGEIKMENVHCGGSSMTCKVAADEGDSRMIAYYDYFHGLET